MASAAPLVWINGFPGSGKMSVATTLQALHGAAILLDNHQLIDPVEAKYPRDHPEYQKERRLYRQLIFEEYVSNTTRLSQLIIFTDFQSNNDLGRAVAMEYADAAQKAGRMFKPIYLTCDPEENIRRVTSLDRISGGTGKLTDSRLLKEFHSKCELFTFSAHSSLTVDDTHMSPHQAAASMLTFINEENKSLQL